MPASISSIGLIIPLVESEAYSLKYIAEPMPMGIASPRAMRVVRIVPASKGNTPND